MKILIADDDHVCAQALMIHLSLLGEIDVAGTGAEAVTKVAAALEKQDPYRLVFLDILMPEGDGHEVLRTLRAQESTRGIHGRQGAKVVMTSCVEDSKQVLKAFRSQAEAYLLKPVEPAKLREVLRELGIIGKMV